MSTRHVGGNKFHYGKEDILRAFRDAGLRRGDIVFITTSLGMLGVAEGVSTSDDLNRLYFDCILETLGPDGTALVPAYSYTFGRGRASDTAVFDPDTTPAEIGPFPEFFRRQPGVIRSLDPMMSICGLGPAARELFADLPPTSYGADSVFARLTRGEAKCCSIGLGPNWTPFIHYADWLAKVPFRFDKLFTGRLRTRTSAGEVRERDMNWLYSVRVLAEPSEANAHRLGQKATEAGIWHYAPLGRARVYVAGYREYFDFAMTQLAVDPWAQAAGPPGPVLEMEAKRVGIARFPLALDRSSDIAARHDALAPLPRHTVSDGYDAALEKLAGLELRLDIRTTPTGANHFDWVVPEKWACRKAQLRDVDGRVLLDGIAEPRHLFPYSLSVSDEVKAADLVPHLQIDGAPPLFERNFMRRDWAFGCTMEEARSLTGGPYGVSIDAVRAYGEMRIGQFILPGQSDETLLLVTHLERGAAGGDTLSGVLSAYEAVARLAAGPKRQANLIFLIVPSTVGLAAWMDLNRDRLPTISAGLTVRGVDGEGPLVLQKAQVGGGRLEDGVVATARAHDPDVRIVPWATHWNEYASGGNPIAPPNPAWGMVPMLTLARSSPPGSGGAQRQALVAAAALIEESLTRALGASA